MDNNTYFPKGKTASSERFEFVAAALLGAAAAFLYLFVRIAVISGAFGYDIAGYGALYIAAGAVMAAGALALGVLLLLSRGGKIPSAASLFACVPLCVGCLLDGIFSIMKHGGFHMSIQFLYFVMALVLTGVLALAVYGNRSSTKTIIASVALTVVAFAAAFIPLMTGDSDWTEVSGMLITPLCFCVIALACFGFREKKNEKDG